MREYYPNLKPAARELLDNMTGAEKRLWSVLRKKQLNDYLFTRQKPLGGFIVDFYCHKAALVIEIDGGRHFSAEAKLNDRSRDDYLRGLGLTVLRFTNSEIIKNTSAAIEMIKKHLP